MIVSWIYLILFLWVPKDKKAKQGVDFKNLKATKTILPQKIEKKGFVS